MGWPLHGLSELESVHVCLNHIRPGQADERILDFSGLLREGYGFGSSLPQTQGSHPQQW